MSMHETKKSPPEVASYSLWQLVRYFLQLGTFGFGGPVALVGYMHRDLVEQRAWITESDYKEGLALAQLAPGPLAAQLAIYIGYVHYRFLGATLVALAFVLLIPLVPLLNRTGGAGQFGFSGTSPKQKGVKH